MFSRLKRIWRPEQFHFHHAINRDRAYFEGWYFKLVDAEGARPHAIIPGVFLGADAHAFIQVLNGRDGTSAYHRFPLHEFHASRDSFDISIGRSRFTQSRISLDIGARETAAQQPVKGEIDLSSWHGWPVTLTSPGVMGPYSFVPFMECNHGILSMDHAIAGQLSIGDVHTCLDDGRGYVEKDWGRGFPKGYVWAQSNHFSEEGISISASVADIPWLTGAFRGYLIGFLLRGKLHRFTTYTGARIEYIDVNKNAYTLCVRDRQYRLQLQAQRSEGALLHAPYDKQMVARVAETMNSVIKLRFEGLDNGKRLYEGAGEHGCLEVQGDLANIIMDGPS
ncbi:tocopherol cyclase family protein [bacterium]|nr:tocopherol cyclase family protein [bacterium]